MTAPDDDPSTRPQPTRRAFVTRIAGVAASAATVAIAGCGSDEAPSERTTSASTTISSTTSTSTTGASTSSTAVTATTAPSAGPATFVSVGPASTDRVALTFHTNGDVGLAHELLDLLDGRKVRVTAFVVGTWLDQHHGWARRLIDGGHELANHTQTHPGFARLSPAQMATEIDRCRDVLTATSGSPGAFFRPSGTANGTDAPAPVVLAVAAAAGYHTVLGYDVDPADYRDPGPSVVARRAIAALHPGAIVSLHFGHAGTIAALPAILDELDRRALTPVTASELLA